jgi:serine/threonine-protein kinase
MAITTHPPVPIAMGTSGTGTEEGRAFHQSRLALYGRWLFLVSGAFLVFFAGVRLVIAMPFDAGVASHAMSTAAAGLIWLSGARGRMQLPAMQAVDAVGTWFVCGTLALMSLGYARNVVVIGAEPSATVFIGILAVSYVLLARAIALPSTPWRTVWIGSGAVLPMIAVTQPIVRARPLPAPPPAMVWVDVLAWLVAAVVMSAVASRVIFGLREEAAANRKLGQYTLDEKVGEGGMGIVYRAHHAMLRRPTAIKLLPLEKAGAENLVRFEREVQLTASLSHPNTVAIFDYGRTVQGVFYYAMEFLDGINLDQLVKTDGPQPPARIVRILEQVSGALAEAHGIGLVHRDIKPGNIILCERGGEPDIAKVVDFGLVKRFLPSDTEATMAATAAQTLLGTPLYMAPESIAGTGEVDARSDLYALGAVGYLLLTATPVFQARSAVEVLAHHLHTPPEPPSSRLGRPVPAELEQVLLQCLAKSVDDRPPSARSLRARFASMRTGDSWTEDDATRWWFSYRRAQRARGPAAGDADASEARLSGA